VQNELNQHMLLDGWLQEHRPAIYGELQTAENSPSAYETSNDGRTSMGVQSQLRAAAAPRRAGKFNGKRNSCLSPVLAGVADKTTGPNVTTDSQLAPMKAFAQTRRAKGCRRLAPRMPGGVATEGQCEPVIRWRVAVCDDRQMAEKEGLKPWGFYGFAVAGCERDDKGMAPVFGSAQTVERKAGLKVSDIDLWN